MISPTNILDAVNALIAAAYPERFCYVGLCPKDFVRPSFFIECARFVVNGQSGNRRTVLVSAYLTITIFGEVDAYGHCDPLELLDTQNAVLGLMRGSCLKVDDRALSIISSAGGADTDTAWVDLQTTFYDDRGDEVDKMPFMATVQTEIKEG